MSNTFKHIPVLDGIRAYAVLMICFVHFFQVDEVSLYEGNKYLGVLFFKISQIGLKGVELFFILSGFLITGILMNSKASPNFFKTFYLRRFIRIFPLYYFVLTISFLVLPNLINVDDAGRDVIKQQGWLWTYLSNFSGFLTHTSSWDASINFPSFGHFWSLCVEEHFYVFWPFLIYFSNDKWLPRLMWSFVGLSIFSVLFVYIFDDFIPILKWSTIQYSGVLSLGGLISYYRNIPIRYNQIIAISKKLILPSGILFLLVNFIPRQYEIHNVLTFYTSIFFFSFFLVLSLEGGNTTRGLFDHKFLYFIGKISYGIYVYHFLLKPYFKTYIYETIKIYIHNGIVSSFIYTVMATLISILIAWLSWQFFEKPILKLKRYFSY
jgi:peptidoglycan/LPS O-acetylase OafA/YrhL|nr:acyltransferase [uncultured Flavobacterium sp.]